MKILCLHATGSNGEAFRSYLSPVVAELQASHPAVVFHFPNGPLAGTGVGQGASALKSTGAASSFHFWDNATLPSLHAAHSWLSDHLLSTAAVANADGEQQQPTPYDGVIALSPPTAAVVSSHMMRRQWLGDDSGSGGSEAQRPAAATATETTTVPPPTSPPPFQFAVFINGSIPLVFLRGDVGAPVPEAAVRVLEEAAGAEAGAEGGVALAHHVARARRALVDSDDCFGLDLNRVPAELKLRIPTAHAWGLGEPMFPAAVQLAGFCDPYIRRVWTGNGRCGGSGGTGSGAEGEGGGRGRGDGKMDEKKDELRQIADMVRWCIDRAKWPGQSEL